MLIEVIYTILPLNGHVLYGIFMRVPFGVFIYSKHANVVLNTVNRKKN